MSFTVTEEAISAMEGAASQLTEGTETIKTAVSQLKSVFESTEHGLGAHSGEIQSLIEELESIIGEANEPVLKLVLKLNKASRIRRAHIDNNTYGGLKR